MRHAPIADPLAKFHRVTGGAARALAKLAALGEHRIELQRKLAEMEAMVAALWLGDQAAHRPALAELRGRIAELSRRERELLDEHARELRQEQVLHAALESRGLIR